MNFNDGVFGNSHLMHSINFEIHHVLNFFQLHLLILLLAHRDQVFHLDQVILHNQINQVGVQRDPIRTRQILLLLRSLTVLRLAVAVLRVPPEVPVQ